MLIFKCKHAPKEKLDFGFKYIIVIDAIAVRKYINAKNFSLLLGFFNNIYKTVILPKIKMISKYNNTTFFLFNKYVFTIS